MAGQQHGMVCLDVDGEVVRPALLWNDTRSAAAAAELIAELGEGEAGPQAWAEAVGSVPVASFTVTKLRWLADHEPESVERDGGRLPPARLADLAALGRDQPGVPRHRPRATPAAPATGRRPRRRTGSTCSPCALGHDVVTPARARPARPGGAYAHGALLGPGAGDNAGAALGLGAGAGDVVVSLGTSGVVCAVSGVPSADADRDGRRLRRRHGSLPPAGGHPERRAGPRRDGRDPRAWTSTSCPSSRCRRPPEPTGWSSCPTSRASAPRTVPDATGARARLAARHLDAGPPGASGRRGDALRSGRRSRRAGRQGATVERVLLSAAARSSEAVRRIAPSVFGRPVVVPEPGEYVADGAARQAAWVLSGDLDPPDWAASRHADLRGGRRRPHVRARYAEVRDLIASRLR